ncbi:MAG: hypothetical protein WD073_10875 [Xanthobacteraceae bacterium]
MIHIVVVLSFLLLSLQAIPVSAETCDAGHGCSITCADGCVAIYNIDTGQCSKACSQAVSAAQEKGKRERVNATFRDAPMTDIENMLKAVK